MPIDAPKPVQAMLPAQPVATPRAVPPAAGAPRVDRHAVATNPTSSAPPLELRSTRLDFHVDEATREIVVRVIDRDSGSVLYQMPSDVALQLARVLDAAGGKLLNTSA